MDANVLVSFLTDRDAQQQEQANDLFVAAARGNLTIFVHQVVLAEIVYALGNFYQVSDNIIRSDLRKLLALPGTTPLDELSWPLLLDLWPDGFADFADAALAAVALQNRSLRIATFDRKFIRSMKKLDIPPFWGKP